MINKEQNNIHCDYCHGINHDFVSGKHSWKILRCRNCVLFFFNLQPPEQYLASIYSKSAGYFATAYNDLSKNSPSAAEELEVDLQYQ